MSPPTIYELCRPRADVLEGRIRDEDFAADLSQVLKGTAPDLYKNPAIFFANTHPTRGLRDLFLAVVDRLTGAGSQLGSILRLDTSYGGGKTHGLIGLRHILTAADQIPNLAEFIDPARLPREPVTVAAFDGENADPMNGRRMEGNILAFTPWGELAVQLAGPAGYERIRNSDRLGAAPPGAETLRELIGERPVLILIDELSIYLRKIKGPAAGQAAEQLTPFLTDLIKAVNSSPQAVLVFTLALGKGGLAQQRHGRSFAELTPEQMMQLSLTGKLAVKPITTEQRRMEERCTAYQRRRGAMASAAAGFSSLFTAAYYLNIWGRESVTGLGCSCPGFPPAGEDVDQACPSLPSCPGQQGGPRIPDAARGCRTIGAAAWIRQQLPEYYRILGVPPESEEVPNVGAALNRQDLPSACPRLPSPAAPPLSLATLAGSAAPASTAGSVYAAAIDTAATCFANPTAPLCQQALIRGDALVLAAKRARRERCLGYALTARTLWSLGADPGFTDLLLQFPEASRLRNEARIALRYLRADCRGL